MSRRVANKKNMISTRIQQQSSSPKNKVQGHQKNTKVKIDGKTISLTFEVKNVGTHMELSNPTNKLPDCIEVKDLGPSTVVNSEQKSPQLQILTDAKEASNKIRYVSLLNGQNNSITLKKNESEKGQGSGGHDESCMEVVDEMDKVENGDVPEDISETKKDSLKVKNFY